MKRNMEQGKEAVPTYLEQQVEVSLKAIVVTSQDRTRSCDGI